MSTPRVLVCGAWDTGEGYPRPASLIAAIRAAGADVDEMRMELPFAGAAKRRLASRPTAWPGMAMRCAKWRREFARRLRKALAATRPAALFVPYPGHLVAPWVRAEFGGPVVLDLFLSAHDTVVLDRESYRPGSLPARFLLGLDRRAARAADVVLLDTPQHAQRIAELTDLPAERFDWVPVSDPRAAAMPYAPPSPGQPLELLFFGTGVPLHGLPFLLAAVARAADVRLTLVGGSPAEREIAARLPRQRLRLLPSFLPWSELEVELRRSHLVSGVFSPGRKAAWVVPFKVVHSLAAGRPVLTAETSAIRHFLTPGEDVWTCRAGDAEAIAAALGRASAAPDQLAAMARRARESFDAHFAAAVLADRFHTILTRCGLVMESAPVAPPVEVCR